MEKHIVVLGVREYFNTTPNVWEYKQFFFFLNGFLEELIYKNL